MGDGRTRSENPDGSWSPAIPLPFQGLIFKKCWTCGKRFRKMEDYLWHYELAHARPKSEDS